MANELVSTGMRAWQEASARNITEGLSSDESVAITYLSVPARTFTTTTLQFAEASNISAAVTGHIMAFDQKHGGEGEAAGTILAKIDYERLGAMP